ncbi:hypothetical protein ABL78_6268 [Leptomonas seymouri]|uniref:Uncharacterized protein n=1 Tax=Leptomonas seymouri TaxID=5684 RepID=A0A0N1HVM9_LEPSE|nr:hypothetical protein ABL78_6268 [Leptomonas seymouri]|eukprot:KPI84674.1 hypothetical protein ABL78_6268 [Leptomonas seymouri]
MVAGTKRGLLLFGLHAFFVQLLVAVFTSFFVEYFLRECLLVVKVGPANTEGSHGAVSAQLSKWGLSLFIVVQAVYAVVASLHRLGLIALHSVTFANSRALLLLRRLSCECRFALLFGLSWLLLHFPLLPSALSFTCVFAVLRALGEDCSAFTTQTARQMALQRPKEGEWISWAARLAATGVAVAMFVTSLLYDSAVQRSGHAGGFHVLIAVVSVSAFCTFGVLQHLRRRTQVEERSAISWVRDDAENSGAPRPPFTSAAMPPAAFNAFARQTCQRSSMKALMAVRVLHCNAHTLVLYFFHFMITLGCGLQLSAATRAALLALVTAASSLLRPMAVAVCAVLGKKRSLSMGFSLAALLGSVSLLLAYSAQDAATAASPAGALIIKPKSKPPLLDVPAASTMWCPVLVVLQRLLLDALRDVLDLAQEDVVEEDTVLFGRASSMSTWTKQLTSVGCIPMQSLSIVMSFVFLAASRALRVVPVETAPWTALTAPLRTPFDAASSASPLTPWRVVVASSTMLSLLGLHTCGVAVVMCVVWQRLYNLEGKHLQFVQMATRKRRDEQAVALV